MKETTILILKRVFEILLEEVGPWLPLGASRNGKGIIPRLQLLVFLFYVTSGIPFRHLAVASGKFIIQKSYRELFLLKIFVTQADCCCPKLGQHREHLTDYGCLVRKSSSLHGQKSNSNPKFLGTAKAHFVCHIGPNFQISLIYAFIGCPQSVVCWKQLKTSQHIFDLMCRKHSN